MLSGRFADAFGTLYLGYACLWYYGQNKHVEGIDAVLELAMETLLKQNQTALHGRQVHCFSYCITNDYSTPILSFLLYYSQLKHFS